MTENTHIAWTHHTANFWWGCQKVSDGCKFCYAETLSKRYGKNIWGPPATTRREFKKAIWKDIIDWDKKARADGVRRRVFVSSMSDFLEDHMMVIEPREKAKQIMRQLTNLDILLLTKRPENAPRFLADWFENWPAHIWIGTTVEDQQNADERIHYLLDCPAPIHFLSVEPQLERIDLDLSGRNYGRDFPNYSESIQWVICGGESGAGCRPFQIEWARDLLKQCRAANVPFFMKQLGGHPYKRDQIEDFPEDLRVREFPK